MEALPRGDSAPYEEFDPKKFLMTYEWTVTQGYRRLDKKKQLEEIILDAIFYLPKHVTALYSSLANSDYPQAREMAALGIAKAFKNDPEAGAKIWNGLLKDENPRISDIAYHQFSEFCSQIDQGLEHNYDLRPIYGYYSEIRY